MSVLGAPKFTGGTPMEVDMERLQRTMQWLAIRKEAGLKLDPETAEVEWCYAQTLDPYGVDPDLPEQCQQIGREYFARSRASDVWVNFRDLPKTIRDNSGSHHQARWQQTSCERQFKQCRSDS